MTNSRKTTWLVLHRHICAAMVAVALAATGCDRGVETPAGNGDTANAGTGDAAPDAPELSDEEAVARAHELAKASLEAMGGREAWDRARYITWRFFNDRRVTWDRHGNRVRMDLGRAPQGRPSILIMDLEAGTGKAVEFGYERKGDDLDYIMDTARPMWVEDSYWLLMPYLLWEPGFKIRYVGTHLTMEDTPAEVIEVSFDGVGPNPWGKYHLYYDPDSMLVVQWDYFTRVADTEPKYSAIWADWKQYGGIMLSSDRGEFEGQFSRLSQIAVYEELPESVFTDFELPDFIKELEAAEAAANAASSDGDG